MEDKDLLFLFLRDCCSFEKIANEVFSRYLKYIYNKSSNSKKVIILIDEEILQLRLEDHSQKLPNTSCIEYRLFQKENPMFPLFSFQDFLSKIVKFID